MFYISVKDEKKENEGMPQDKAGKFPESEVVRIQKQSDGESEEVCKIFTGYQFVCSRGSS